MKKSELRKIIKEELLIETEYPYALEELEAAIINIEDQVNKLNLTNIKDKNYTKTIKKDILKSIKSITTLVNKHL